MKEASIEDFESNRWPTVILTLWAMSSDPYSSHKVLYLLLKSNLRLFYAYLQRAALSSLSLVCFMRYLRQFTTSFCLCGLLLLSLAFLAIQSHLQPLLMAPFFRLPFLIAIADVFQGILPLQKALFVDLDLFFCNLDQKIQSADLLIFYQHNFLYCILFWQSFLCASNKIKLSNCVLLFPQARISFAICKIVIFVHLQSVFVASFCQNYYSVLSFLSPTHLFMEQLQFSNKSQERQTIQVQCVRKNTLNMTNFGNLLEQPDLIFLLLNSWNSFVGQSGVCFATLLLV